MQISLLKIGNSKGIRLSKTIIEKYGLRDTDEVILEKGHIIIRPSGQPRAGWDAAFKEMADNGDDHLLFDDVLEDEDFEEWK